VLNLTGDAEAVEVHFHVRPMQADLGIHPAPPAVVKASYELAVGHLNLKGPLLEGTDAIGLILPGAEYLNSVGGDFLRCTGGRTSGQSPEQDEANGENPSTLQPG
jgi:hypothetical protein